jgi:hypothetical protein
MKEIQLQSHFCWSPSKGSVREKAVRVVAKKEETRHFEVTKLAGVQAG